MKRFLDCNFSDFASMNGKALKESIAASEGRVMLCETIGAIRPILGDVTNAEFAASLGADIILLNVFDVLKPHIEALPTCPPEDSVRQLKRLCGRPIAINLEPLLPGQPIAEDEDLWSLSPGRRGTVENALRAADMGVDMIVLTGNPGIGVSNQAITESLAAMRQALGDRLLLAAGKMHASGVLSEAADKIISREDVEAFVRAGADIILLPAPGTVPGVTLEQVRDMVSLSRSLGALALTAIGTSQEGADEDSIRRIALMCKMSGADLHHLGDAGYLGMAVPENILAYGKAIRGVRHTYHRMAASIRR